MHMKIEKWAGKKTGLPVLIAASPTEGALPPYAADKKLSRSRAARRKVGEENPGGGEEDRGHASLRSMLSLPVRLPAPAAFASRRRKTP